MATTIDVPQLGNTVEACLVTRWFKRKGDSVAAESLYRSALALTGNSPGLESDRLAIRENLEKLKAPR